MRHRGFTLCGLLLTFTALAGCSRSAGLFSDQNARAHVEMLAGTIGSRSVGTPENARARAYVVDQLRLFGYEVRVQETDARRSEFGLTTRVANVIATLPGNRPEAIGLLSHYDSSADAPGAADDAFGVAVSLEAARVIAAKPRTWTTFVLVTDAEEIGLMGAAALLNDHDVKSRLQAYLNIEATGSSGTATLFETGPANHWLVKPWARRAPHPRGGSFAGEIYRRLPNDTDFSILKRHEVPGLNFALIGDSYAYHTARDSADRLSQASLRATGENVVSILDALQQADITQRTPRDATYFDIGGTTAISYSAALDWILPALGVVLSLIAWVRATRFVVSQEGIARWMLGFAWAALAVAAVAGAMTAATWMLRSAREVYHPWYARPDRFFLMLVAVGVLAAWVMTRAGRWIPARAHGLRHPSVVWTYTLPLWIAMAVGLVWMAPGAAYLWTLPLFAAGVLLSVTPPSAAVFVRIASVVILAVSATLWMRDTLQLLRFMVALFGRLPLVTPVYVYAALITVAGLLIGPPLIAAATSAHRLARPKLVTAVCLLAVAVTATMAYRAPAYTREQPLRRQARAFQEAGAAESIWQVSSTEPGLDLADDAPGLWMPGPSQKGTSVPWPALREPFVFSGTGPVLGPAPASISSFGIEDVPGGLEVSITVVPSEPGITVTFLLPQGATPARSSIPGTARARRWTAIYVAPPPDGIAFRASFTGVTAERLRETQVAVTSARLPGGDGWQRLPAWLPQDRLVWTARATWVLPHPAALEPVPPLR